MLHSLHYGELSPLDDGRELVIGHINGTLELRGVLRAEGRCLHCKCDCGAARRDLPPVVGVLADRQRE